MLEILTSDENQTKCRDLWLNLSYCILNPQVFLLCSDSKSIFLSHSKKIFKDFIQTMRYRIKNCIQNIEGQNQESDLLCMYVLYCCLYHERMINKLSNNRWYSSSSTTELMLLLFFIVKKLLSLISSSAFNWFFIVLLKIIVISINMKDTTKEDHTRI